MHAFSCQVAKVCAEMKGMSELADGFNAVGFSQGGQFMRALVERCSHEGIQARTLITLGAQHQGISSVPGCRWVAASSMEAKTIWP
ncbi:Alpha/Beta hydrolase protein [Dunaliella salina]|uniref:Alpha/Beta hydrolase protein n=1 Tax=Dunaliella salina TaxID=3046 RepID=A0ABQ7G3B0_DUNSA|nr:Alpha/Beta hydrolase protein [Dunaliella salina]|eukprot:KAF5829085.1 Alpha/Beta hydrolase protein [Dunaliella salina]